MPYVTRDAHGAITAVMRDDPGGAERLEGSDPQLAAFVGVDAPRLSPFERMDIDFVRVLEDLIDTLTARNVLNITDLPESAQAKLFARRSFRERQGRNALHLFSDTGLQDVI